MGAGTRRAGRPRRLQQLDRVVAARSPGTGGPAASEPSSAYTSWRSDAALQRPARLAQLLGCRAVRQPRAVRQQGIRHTVSGSSSAVALGVGQSPARASTRRRTAARALRRVDERAGVEPGPGQHRRHVRGRVHVGRLRGSTSPSAAELLGVPLLDHAEAAELALDAVEVAVVVGVAGDEPVAADPVVASRPARPPAPGTAAGSPTAGRPPGRRGRSGSTARSGRASRRRGCCAPDQQVRLPPPIRST